MLKQVDVLLVFIYPPKFFCYEVALWHCRLWLSLALIRPVLMFATKELQPPLSIVVASLVSLSSLLLTVLSSIFLHLHAVVQVVDIPLLLVQNVQPSVPTHMPILM